MTFRAQRHASIDEIDATAWNDLAGRSPFLRHEFLAALERTGCVGQDTAWQPAHLSVRNNAGALVGALPLYIKYDSRGEFVFDWSWANAYDQSGLSYYPKLVSAVPFTPATGQRLLTKDGEDFAAIAGALINAVETLREEIDASSVHVLFPTDRERGFLASEGFGSL